MMTKPCSITFVGTASYMPEAGRDTASILVGRNILIDAGWCSVLQLLRLGHDPDLIDHLVITHFHHDHYMGIPQLLFRLGSKRALTIVGPAGDIETVTELALRFLQTERYPNIAPQINLVPLAPGDAFSTPQYLLETCRSKHSIPGLSYRFTHLESNTKFVITGDTAYNPDLIEFCRECALLVHEAAYADTTPPEGAHHSGAAQAGEIARQAGVSKLLLIHANERRRSSAVAMAARYHPNVDFANEGQCVLL